MFNAPPPRPAQLTFFPDYRATNPYQWLLYDGLGPAVEAEAGTLGEALLRQGQIPGGRALFHLHWENAVLSEPGSSAERFLNDLAVFRERGGRVIWTVHNLEPHDSALRQRVADLHRGLIPLVDVVHLHSLPAVAAARAALPLSPERIRVIPHGSYEGAYPVMPRTASLLAGSRMVVLLPGRMADYKQPEALISAFSMAAGPEDLLIVAGQPAPDAVLPEAEDPRVILKPGFATPDELARLHAACDFVALPYARSLTSGSAILAATLGRGVLGPDVPGLRDVVESPRTGVLYEGARPAALPEALGAALREGPRVWAARGEAAHAALAARDRRMISALWRDLIAALLATAAPARVGPPA